MEKLRGCFSTWQHAQESVQKIARLLRIDLKRIVVDGKPFTDTLDSFTQQLRLIKTALENRDFVSLIDTLVYETAETSSHWQAAINSIAPFESPQISEIFTYRGGPPSMGSCPSASRFTGGRRSF
jgi:hypothetical protein